MATDMNATISNDSKSFFEAAQNGRLKEVSDLSTIFRNDSKVLNEAFIWACREGHLNAVKWLAEHTATDVNYNNKEVWGTPLSAACYNDHLHILKYLVKTCHVNVNLPDKYSDMMTPLTMACSRVSMGVLMFLLREVDDLDINIADRYGNIALHYAVWCRKYDYTQLHVTCGRGDVTEVLRLVYVIGHDINVQDNNGDTPLHRACYYGHKNIIETLLLAGADETITNDDRKTLEQLVKGEELNELRKLLNIDKLWRMILKRRKKLELSPILLIMLIVKLMSRPRDRLRRFRSRSNCSIFFDRLDRFGQLTEFWTLNSTFICDERLKKASII